MRKIIARYKDDPGNTEAALAIDVHPVLKKIYQHRGIISANELERSLKHLLPYHALLNIDEAVMLLYKALCENQRIMIIGDFDADGATSTALVVNVLRAFGAKQVSYLVPNRFEYGYGLTKEIVAVAAKGKPDLIITVDNGISSVEGVAVANALGVNVLITDHHLPGDRLPEAAVIVNPNQSGDQFASKHLAGVGVIFYVMLALRAYLREKAWFSKNNIAEPNLADFLDLVALGTYADVVPLDKNNRILVYQGLRRIRAGRCRYGIKALLSLAKRDYRTLTAADLGYAVGPRLNAAGRLDDMSLGIACLLADTPQNAQKMAQVLDGLNQERRLIEDEMRNQAMQELYKLHLENNKNLPVGLCLFDEAWHQGVIGILAGRIKERLHRPVVAFAPAGSGGIDGQAIETAEIKGSARSIEGLHIRDVLANIAAKYPGLITKFGGHAMAAGLSLAKQNFSAFRRAFNEVVQARVSSTQLQHKLLSDADLHGNDLNLQLAELIQASGPWGQAFPEPLFDGCFEIVNQRLVGNKHLKLTLKKDGCLVDAIAFNIDLERWPNHHCRLTRIAYRLDINEYNGLRSLQLIVEYLEPVDKLRFCTRVHP